MKRSANPNPVSERLATLADPTRLRVMRLLEREELSVGELARIIQLPQSTVSRHLKVLNEGGWLVRRAEGTATLYRVMLDDLPEAERGLWLAVRGQFSPTAESAEDARRLSAVLADRRSDSRAFFGRVAGQWDDVRAQLFGPVFTMRGLLALVPSGWRVADLGCGTGNAAELLAPIVERVIAVDHSEPMLEAARKRLSGYRNVEFRVGELSALPIEDASVDAAVVTLVLHHLAEPIDAIREASRVLVRGGTLLVIDMLEHDRDSYRHTMGHVWLGFSRERMEGWFAEAGFSSRRFIELPSFPESAGPGLFACAGVKGA